MGIETVVSLLGSGVTIHQYQTICEIKKNIKGGFIKVYNRMTGEELSIPVAKKQWKALYDIGFIAEQLMLNGEPMSSYIHFRELQEVDND